MEKFKLKELALRSRSPVGAIAVVIFLVCYIFEVLDKANQLVVHLPAFLRFLASPLAVPVVLMLGLGLIFWEVHDIRKTSGEVSRLALRQLLIHSAITAGVVLVLILASAAMIGLVGHWRRNQIASLPSSPTPASREIPKPIPSPVADISQILKKESHKGTKSKPKSELSSAASQQIQTQVNSAPKGMIISGGNVTSPTVNNAPPPAARARLNLFFWTDINPRQFGKIVYRKATRPVVDGKVHLELMVTNYGMVTARNGQYIIRLFPGTLTLATEPEGALPMPAGAIPSERHFPFEVFQPNSRSSKISFDAIPEPGMNSFVIEFTYECETCEDEVSQFLEVRIGSPASFN